jgi:2-polyprenyl-6-methoxyphenol hydroxylase-like FAD-dependent oxidoreductase
VERVVIIGGGIGGLTVAHGLARRGIDVQIIEAGQRGDRLGTGITLLGNALRALDTLGLADEITANGFGWDAVFSRDAAGNLLDERPAPRTYRPDKPAALGIMRTMLAEILERNAVESGAMIRFGTTAEMIEQDDDQVTVQLSSGETLHADMLIAADGVYSKTRTAIFGPEFVPTYTGQSGWRYTVPRPENIAGFTLYRGPDGQVIGGLPLGRDKAYLFMLEQSEEHVRMPEDRLGELLRERFEPYTAPELRQAADEIDGDRHISFRPFDIQLMPRPWYRGRIVLLGDAAHSLTPHMTSGGGMAIEDAAVLCDEVGRWDSVAAVLEAYDDRRFARVEPIYTNSLRICELEKMPDGGEEAVRLLIETHGLLAQPF